MSRADSPQGLGTSKPVTTPHVSEVSFAMALSLSPIAFLTPHYPPDGGGVAAAAQRLARGLARRLPIEVLVPSAQVGPGRVEITEEDGVTVVRFGLEGPTENQQRWFELLTTRGPYLMIHAVYPSLTGFTAVYGARHLNIPCLLAARGNDLDRDAFRPARQAGLLHALAGADAVVGVSRALTRQAEALGAVNHVAWVPNGIDTHVFSPVAPDPALRARLGLEGAGPVIGFVGEARRKTGLVTLLEAFDTLLATRPDARFLFVGGIRPDDRALAEVFLAQHPAVAAAVTRVDWVPQAELPAYYALMDVLWHPSTHDGLPNALLEALACGRLAVGANVGGIPDILDPEELPGLLVPPRDPEALVAATLELLDDPATYEALEGRAYAHVTATFSTTREIEGYMSLYERLTRRTLGPAL
jgi:glycosyltransferase involved in cell wall biosynthesis